MTVEGSTNIDILKTKNHSSHLFNTYTRSFNPSTSSNGRTGNVNRVCHLPSIMSLDGDEGHFKQIILICTNGLLFSNATKVPFYRSIWDVITPQYHAKSPGDIFIIPSNRLGPIWHRCVDLRKSCSPNRFLPWWHLILSLARQQGNWTLAKH